MMRYWYRLIDENSVVYQGDVKIVHKLDIREIKNYILNKVREIAKTRNGQDYEPGRFIYISVSNDFTRVALDEN